jgi:hypothetical protein
MKTTRSYFETLVLHAYARSHWDEMAERWDAAAKQILEKTNHTHPTGFLKKCWNNLFIPATRQG